jgi:hypothetical protein
MTSDFWSFRTFEKSAPLGVNGGRIGLVFCVEVVDIGGIAAIEERRFREDSVGVLAGHGDVKSLRIGACCIRPKGGLAAQ